MRELTTLTFKRVTRTMLLSIFVLVTGMYSALLSQCPTIQFVDLRGTPGFPQTDDLNVCGAPDTLSILMFTDAPGDVQGFEFTVNMVSGMRYAGFEEAHYGGCTSISNTDANINSPEFIGGGLTCGDIFVANIGVTADCSVDLTGNDYLIEIDYSYTYFPPTGGSIKCKGTEVLENDFNGAIKESVLNMTTPSPIDVTVTSLGAPTCQSFQISQDGLQAYLDEFKFAVCGLEFGATSPIAVSSMTANGMDILGSAVFNPADTTLTACLDATIFPSNDDLNPGGTPEQFDVNEKVIFEVCYEVANCPAGADLPFSYKAWYGCFDEVCQQTGQSSFLKVRPTGSLLPTISATLENGIEICGEDAKVSAMLINPNTDTDQNVYTDLHIGFQACGMEAFMITDVMINGVSVPPVFEILGDDIDIDLSMNTDPGIGLYDYDGDGFFDDLPGGADPLDIMVTFSLACGAGAEGGCPEINCENVQFYVSGKTNCGNNFQGFPPTGGFNLQYGQEAVSNIGEVALNSTGSVIGYDFGAYSNDGAPIAGTNSSEIEVEFCYEFAQENIEDCPSGGETKMLGFLGGPAIMMGDIEVVPGSVMMDDGTGYVAVPDSDVSLTPTSGATATLEINAGNNNPTLCYKYSLRLDECHCGPVQYIALDQQIVSVCSDCTPDCEIVKGCRSTLLSADPQCTDCPCMAQYVPLKTERKNLGYVDKAMTRKITRDELVAAGGAVDLSRFMPGDTLWHQGYWDLLDEDLLYLDDPARWVFAFRMQTIAGSATSGEVQAALPLTFEAGSMLLNEMRIENPDGSVHIVDMSTLPACAVDPTALSPTINSFDTHWETPWGDDPNTGYACTTGSWEGYDGNQTAFELWNFDRMEEVNSINPNVATFHTRGSGDCVTEFIETYGLIEGSRIYFDWCAPMIKNPLREMAKIIGEAPPEENTARIVQQFTATPFDEIAGSSAYGFGANESGCPESAPFQISCPGGIRSETNIVLDNCGGTIEHAFVVDAFAGPPGDEWFTYEYKPLIELHDLELPIYSPLAYCANAQVEQNGVITHVTVDSVINMSCSPVGGYSDDLCAVETGASGAIVIDLYDQGFSGLGIGLDNCDTLKLSYDYCMICPAPLEGILDYQVKADWCYLGGTPNQCQIDAATFYDPRGTGGATTLGNEANAAGYVGTTWHNRNYYDIFNLDTLFCKIDDTQGVVFIDDSAVTPMMAVAASLVDGQELIASETAGVSIEVKEVEFCNPDPMDATGFSGYVTVPNAVEFVGACADAAGATEFTSTLVSDDGQTQKYMIEFTDMDLSENECVSVFVKTRLLFCPLPGSLPPEICVGGSAGCSPAEVRAAIGGSGACAGSEVCYAYLFGEADLQTEWFSMPEDPALCETFTLHVRTKNVKDLVLLNLDPSFTLPFGLSVVPNSWEVAYPGGAVDMTGNFGAWTGVPDPDVVSGFDYSWSDDALWSSHIDMNGLVGVSSTLDSNNVAFRFQVTTNCDEFLSGSKPRTETMASDPCGPGNLTSGDVESPAIIIDGADPADYAQILAVGSPAELYCGGLENTFGLTALNVSEKPTTDSVVTCITIPGDVLTYTPGSIRFTNGFMPDWITETPIGNDIQVCVHSPALPPGQAWSLEFEAIMNEDAPCGEIEIGADIKSVVESVSCVPGPPDECDVFVQNSLNPVILIDLKPPLETTDVRVSSDCSMGGDPVQICYEVDLSNPGPAYSGNVNVAIIDDVTANGVVDSFDGELNSADHAVSLASGESVTIMMCLDVDAIQSCPIIIKQTYETDCACDSEETPIMNLLPSWFADLEECTVLCPTQPLMLETCGDFELTFDPIGGATAVDDGTGVLTVTLADGFGIDAPVVMNLTGMTGECEVMGTVELKSIGDWMPSDLEADICENDCVDLDLLIPDEIVDGATITWTPEIGLDDPTSATPEVCGLTADQVYEVEIRFNEDCAFNIEYTVTYNPNGVTTITGEEFCLCSEAGTLTGAAGFSSYEWYSIRSGAEILEAITTTNTWTGPTEPGDYFLKAYLGGAICPNVSNVVTLEGKECVDLELEKSIINIPDPLVLGSQITYELVVCNIADDDLGLKFDATNVEISDELPGAVTYVQHTQTSGNYSPTTNQWDITSLENGTCDTLWIDVTIDMVGVIENTAQISGSDNEDIDSEENNDDGDQSEDDEDNAVIELQCESVAGEIFYDLDDNGCQDMDEGLVMEQINVSLYECGDVPGTDPPAAVTSTLDGMYEFGVDSDDPGADICLTPGTDYFVVFDIPNDSGEALEDYEFSSEMAGAACEAAGDADDVDPATGMSDCYDPDDADGNDGNSDESINAGITPPCYEMAGEIFYDNNDDGCQDADEPLVMEAVEVSLYECGDIPGVDQPAASTTVSDGMYEFGEDSDDPGADYCLENNTEYFVVFNIPNASGEALEDYEFSNGEASGACAVAGESDNVDPATGASGCYDPDDDDSSDGDDDQNVDAGITPPCHEIAGEIFYDNNDNGCQDGSESLVMEPIGVMLFECGADPAVDAPVASTAVADGMYEFGEDSDDPGADVCLDANTEYFVVFDIPNGSGETLEGYEFSSMEGSPTCEAAGQTDDVDPATGASDCVNPDNDDPGDGDADQNVDAGIAPPCHTLGGEIFYDGNNDGCQDMGESLVMEAINVTLYECGDTPGVDPPAASTTVTDGTYEFGESSDDPGADVCLDAGTEYFVVFDIPNGAGEALEDYEFSEETATGACATDGNGDDVDPATGASGCYDPANDDGGDGSSDENIDAGITPPCEQISGEIFYDNNNNGCEDPGEELVMEDINVTLYVCGDTPGVDTPVASTTVSDGEYAFGETSDDEGADVCLDANTEYFVVFDIPNAIGEALEEHEFSTGAPSAACEADGESSDVDPATGETECATAGNGDGDGDENLDAGIVPPCEDISGEIFYDGNDNGCQDMGESLVDLPVEVSLYECGDIPGVDQPLASTTVTDGMYEFSDDSEDPGADICLEAGTEYFVSFDLLNGPGEALDGYEFSSMNASGECAVSGESDNVDPTTGSSGCHDPNDDDGSDGDDDNNIDAGIVPPCEQLAGEIFYDGNENGCQDSDEMLVTEDVNVTLYECGATPGTDAPVASTTVSNGMYTFGENSDDPGADVCLDAGTEYFVVFDIPNGPGEDLEDYQFTSGAASPGCEATGDSDDVDPATGESECYDPSSDDGDDDENIDAGIVPPCEQISGEIFYDLDDNGCQDSGESLVMEAIDVLLFECGDDPSADTPVASTTVTDGDYTFGENSMDPGADVCLEAGTEYFVVFDIPNAAGEALDGHEFSSGMTNSACAADGESDDVNPSTGASGCVDPDNNDGGDGDDDENVDAGIVPPCFEMAGEIFYDENGNGCQDGDEELVMTSVMVSLYECGDTPGVDLPAAMTMVVDGEYEFGPDSEDPSADICLQNTTEYFVVFDIPNSAGDVLDGYEFTEGDAAPACEAAGGSDDVDPATGASECYNPDDGPGNDNVDAGITPPCESLAGEIFYDMNDNGCEDADETLVMEAIEVSIFECGDNPAVDQPFASTTVTDGMYEFGPDSDDAGANVCLEAGTEYFVLFDIPNGAGEALDGAMFSSNNASGACAASGESDNVDPSTGASGCYDPDNDDGSDGDGDENIDAGIVPPCETIAGEIFYDGNGNGCQDGNEGLVMEVINVTLYECGATPGMDSPAASTSVTDGAYEFGPDSDDPGADVCLDPATEYFVVFDIPMGTGDVLEGYEFTEGTASAGCETAGQSDDVDPTTGASDCVNPGGEDDDNNVDAGITPPCEQISGEIFYDDNNNGCQDLGEPLVMEPVDVILYQCGDIPGLDQPAAATTVTDGDYTFGAGSTDPGADVCLEAGEEYFVVFDLPNGPGEELEDYYFSENIAPGACLLSGEADNVDPSTGMSSCHNPANDDDDDGDGDENIDAGIMHPCEILAGEIFYDYDNDGCQDDSESLVTDPVNVTLFNCGDDPATSTPVASTTTTDGTYMFGDEYSVDSSDDPCLNPRLEYFVVFDFDDSAGATLEDHYFSDGEAADGGCEGTADSDDVDSDSGESGCYSPDGDDDDMNIDAGITPCEEISGEVFYDWNANGCQDDAGETPVEGVDVYIFECGETDPNPSNALASSSTNADGEYTFGPEEDGTAEICLHPDKEYFVLFDIPNGDGEEHEDFYVTDGDGATCAGGDTADDVDATTATSGCLDPDDDDDDDDVDAGITPCENIGGEVFYDNDGDGCQDDATEGPVPGVNVYIFECGETDTSPANALASDTTNADGEYEFGPEEDGDANICLDPTKDYFVVFDVPNAAGESLDDFSLTEGDSAACAGGPDSNDVDPATGASECYDPDGDDDDSNVDAGIQPCEEISGQVFYDWNTDGCQDMPLESGVEGVDVYVYSCDETNPTPGNALASDTTDENGEYTFGPGEDGDADICLQADEEYFVLFDLPNDTGEMLAGFDFTPGDGASCSGTSDEDDTNPATGQTDCYDPSGDGSDDIDAGIEGCLDLGGEVFYDMNGDGCQDPDTDGGAEGVDAYLYNCDESDPTPGNALASTTTDANGEYNFGPSETGDAMYCLHPDSTYYVVFDIPNAAGESLEGYNFTEGAGTACAGGDSADDVDSSTGQSPCYDPMDNDGDDGNGDENVDAGIAIYDLALTKVIKPTGPVQEGDDVCFTITVFNQGTLPAYNVLVNDYIPSGFLLSANDTNGWTSLNAAHAQNAIAGPIMPMSSGDVEIVLTVQPGATLATLMNVAEIGMFEDVNGNDVTDQDVDSTGDNDPDNDGPFEDNDTGGTNGDEDDSDPAWPPVFDLSLIKTTTDTDPVVPGNIITYMIEVCNQGNIAGQNILITDYPDAGMALAASDANGWTQNADGSLSVLYTQVIGPGKCETIEIDMEVQNIANAQNTMNFAEIEMSQDDQGNDTTGSDIDSEADGNDGNDDFTSDDDHSSSGGDEDDHDGEQLPVFDLALRKFILNPGPYGLGEIAKFDIEICNQGNITAQDVGVVDYIPSGLEFAADGSNAAWTLESPSLATTTYTGQIAPGQCVEVPIWLTVISADPDGLVNMSEITSAKDDLGNDRTNDDVDSTPDMDNSNDNGNDPFSDFNDFNDQSSYAGGDEDDHDQAWLLVCVDMVCQGHINVSLDEDCEVAITPAMMLSPGMPGFSSGAFEIEITDQYGNVVDNSFDASDIGNTFNVSVISPGCDNNSCWGTMTVEDKFGPTLDCNAGPFDVPCNGVNQVPAPTAMENCGTYEIVLIDEVEEVFQCEDMTGRITRTWVAIDAAGNQSAEPCVQVINIIRPDLSAISLHDQIVSISCNEIIELDENGYPAPWVEPSTGSGTGVPILCVPGYGIGVDCATGSGTGDGFYLIPGPQDQVCNTFVSYEDTPVPTNDCSEKIIRRFEVREWWCGGELTWAGTQVIEIVDDQAPEITCPGDMTVTTEYGCESDVFLPPASAVDVCGNDINYTVQVDGNNNGFPGAFLDGNGGNVTLPVGQNIITYTAFDECHNSSTCTMTVTVEDLTQPVAICEQNTVVSLPTGGNVDVWAQTFDDGSFDECDILRYEVLRMASTCNPLDVTEWDDIVSFCCDDIGQDVMVLLRVWDHSGNYNQCMVNVTVQDKTIPELTCPADVSAPCTTTYDLNNLSATFSSPSASDNCSANNVTEVVTPDVASCGTGTITRDFSIEDANGNVLASCTQVITLTQADPMTEDDIIWPVNFELFNGCDLSAAHPDALPADAGYPTVIEGVCDLVGYNYEDEVFTNVPGSDACVKILRTWQVINWCQVDENGDLVIWDWTQVILINNTIDPVITSDCNKLTFTSTDVDCSPLAIVLTNFATDDCTPSDALTWTWTVDAFTDNDSSNDVSGTGPDASGTYPIGLHTITWTVQDQCGNVDFCTQEFEIINTKTPTAICIYGLSSELIPMDLDLDGTPDTEMVTVWSSDFDGGSNHPCGYAVDVSFSADPNDDFISFGCNQVGEQPISLWVTDTNGNTAVCETFILITNNLDEGLCTGLVGNINVQGRVTTEEDQEVEDVLVNLNGSNLTDMTDGQGDYSFDNMPMGGTYNVVPGKNDDIQNGVTTLDVIHIQRHILGIELLDSPYQHIAADANNSGTISGIDLVNVRKVILGVADSFQNNTSWRFIDREFEFNSNFDPLDQDFPESYEIPALTTDMIADFVGVKVGDVNGSVETNGLLNNEAQSRSSKKLQLLGSVNGDQIDLKSAFDRTIRGFQMTISYDPSELMVEGLKSSVIDLNEDSYYINNEEGYITISWNSQKATAIENNDVLFSLVAKGSIQEMAIDVNSSVTAAEAYDEDFQIMEVSYDAPTVMVENILHQNEPNPWISKTVIRFDLSEASPVQFVFRDTEGKLIKQVNMKGVEGNNVLEVKANEIDATGVVYYEMLVGEERVMKKMILLK